MHLDVNDEISGVIFAWGVVVLYRTDGLPGKNTIKIKGCSSEAKFFFVKCSFLGGFIIGKGVFGLV